MKVKICGVTHPVDAIDAALFGADYIGIIFAKRSKRAVSLPLAIRIAEVCRAAHVEPVGVFEEQSIHEIQDICQRTGIKFVQLHGVISENDLRFLSEKYSVFYSISAGQNHSISYELPNSVTLLYDNSNPGNGASFDWVNFRPPNFPWILAGGLTPDNIKEAIDLLKPHGVDVATGVERTNSTRKDPSLVKAFIKAAKQNMEQ